MFCLYYLIRSYKGTGCDNIGPNILKFCSSELTSPLARLFSMCMDQHSIPTQWKHYLIIPIHKNGNSSSVASYRPLLCVTSKVLESQQNCWPKLSSSQYGFQKNRSCLTQLLTSSSSIPFTYPELDMHCRLSFSLFSSAILCLCGARSSYNRPIFSNINSLDRALSEGRVAH